MSRVTGVLLIFIFPLVSFISASGQKENTIYREGWIDYNKNSKKDIYEDPNRDIDERVEDLLSIMNLDEKTCQMATLYGFARVLEDELPT